MMKKPTSKKMMPAKKAMMGSKMVSTPMMKKGGSVKKYSDGGLTKKSPVKKTTPIKKTTPVDSVQYFVNKADALLLGERAAKQKGDVKTAQWARDKANYYQDQADRQFGKGQPGFTKDGYPSNKSKGGKNTYRSGGKSMKRC
jgi:hypothetical protein